MLKLLGFFTAVLAAALAGTWIAERPGSVEVVWLGHRVAMSTTVAVALAVAALAIAGLAAGALRTLAARPALARAARERRTREAGMRALLDGWIALGSGDRRGAIRLVAEAKRALPAEPAVRLLEARTAAAGDERAQARAHLAAMIEDTGTRLAGLHGLYREARADGQIEVAMHFAEQAAEIDPELPWAAAARFDHAVALGNWERAAGLLEQDTEGVIASRDQSRRWRAVLLTALALELAPAEPRRARSLALEAHGLAPDLVPAAIAAARLAAESDELERGRRVIEATWRRTPHPELAESYAELCSADTALARLEHVARLSALHRDHRESAIALARSAIDAREFALARSQLARLVEIAPSQRVCVLMAEFCAAGQADQEQALRWLARAVDAPRDPCWTADGVVAGEWSPVSPVTGRLDAFEWKLPNDTAGPAPRSSGLRLDRIAPLIDPLDRWIPAPLLARPAQEASLRSAFDEDARFRAPAVAAGRQAAPEAGATRPAAAAAAGGEAMPGGSDEPSPTSEDDKTFEQIRNALLTRTFGAPVADEPQRAAGADTDDGEDILVRRA